MRLINQVVHVLQLQVDLVLCQSACVLFHDELRQVVADKVICE